MFVVLPTFFSVLQDFTSRKETREVFLHNCNSLFEMLIQIPRKCTRTRSLNLDALTKKKEEANNHWVSICIEIARHSDTNVSLIK